MNKIEISKDNIKKGLYYTGSKHKVIKQIKQHLPDNINNLYVPFCGGLNDVLNIKAKVYYLNDNCKQLIQLYEYIDSWSSSDRLNNSIESLVDFYELDNQNREAYLRLRNDYNSCGYFFKPKRLLTLIFHSFSNQMRFNDKDEFNLPFGKRTYNKESKKRLNNLNNFFNNNEIKFYSSNFLKFLKLSLFNFKFNDFILLDPPYLQSDATYSKSWNEDNLIQLLNYLKENIDNIKFGLTEFLYCKGNLNYILNDWIKLHKDKLKIVELKSNFNNSSYQRKSDKGITTEIYITNYIG